MSGSGLLVVVSLGAALLALWSYLRWPGAAPANLRGAVIRVVAAFCLLQVGALPLGAAAGAPVALAVLALVGVVVPLLSFAFLTSLWIMRLFAEMLRGYV